MKKTRVKIMPNKPASGKRGRKKAAATSSMNDLQSVSELTGDNSQQSETFVKNEQKTRKTSIESGKKPRIVALIKKKRSIVFRKDNTVKKVNSKEDQPNNKQTEKNGSTDDEKLPPGKFIISNFQPSSFINTNVSTDQDPFFEESEKNHGFSEMSEISKNEMSETSENK
ncbi:hypothetical protein M153_3214000505, partial [Pseudoloma neurophilia]